DTPDATWIVLAHQAGSSRGEYRTIAPRLNKLGFNAIAIDQRSGKAFGGVRNETAQRAAARGIRRNYASALPDIKAAITFARKQTKGRVILWGSSYSAALALWMAGQDGARIDAVVSMSPGEYIRGRGIARAAAKIKVPVLITSPTSERRKWRKIFKAIPGERKVGFAPSSGGRHGSSALIPARNKSSDAYWAVVEKFLADHVS
ncbi:MAG: alpha/beta hydrolase, partial [Hyphomicrobiaceae bacterium]